MRCTVVNNGILRCRLRLGGSLTRRPTITGLILGEIGRLVKEPPNRKRQRKIPLFTTVHRKHLMLEE